MYVVLGLIVLVVLFFGAIFLYAKVINDSPAEFTAGDLDAALSSQAGRRPDATGAPGTVATGQPPVPTAAPSGARRFDRRCHRRAGRSQWVATDSSQVGYRVKRCCSGSTRPRSAAPTRSTARCRSTARRSRASTSASTSPRSRATKAAATASSAGRVMSADEFPTATFTLTQPIELGADADRRRRGHGARRPAT